jgi:hypothetical protein
MSSSKIIASTLGFDQAEISEYRYQSTRTSQAIYAIGNFYFACSKRKPKDLVGGTWEMHKDQFFASQNKSILWLSQAL